jgi:hypothetical protein
VGEAGAWPRGQAPAQLRRAPQVATGGGLAEGAAGAAGAAGVECSGLETSHQL